MGEIAEMMLDGTLCQSCGAAVPGPSEGIPRRCKACRMSELPGPAQRGARQAKALCCVCGRSVTRAGMADHIKALHSTPAPQAHQTT